MLVKLGGIRNGKQAPGITIFRDETTRWMRRAGQQAVAGLLAAAMLPLSLASAVAQDYGAPPPPPDYEGQSAYQALAPEQIDSLVAPIALYPDSLVAQVLAAATYPAQVASAGQFVQQNAGYPPDQLAQLANTQPWDPSVKSLVAFPQVLNNLNSNMDWTTQLGNAYYNQPQDVLSAVQGMRQRAYAAGNLRTTPQLAVTYAPDDILIAPASPTVVYVPYYDPWSVYGAPIAVYPRYRYYGPPRGGIGFGTGLAIGFGVGIAVAAFTHFSWGYHNWQPDWRSRTVLYNRNTYISRSVTVINHGNYGHFDRNPQARVFNQQQAVRFGGAGNRTTINNVTVNRGGNTYNNGGNTVNRGDNTFNRGDNTFNRGGNTFNRGPGIPASGGGAPGGFNRGPGEFNRGPGGQPGGPAANPGGQPGAYRGGNTAGNTFGRAPYVGGQTAPARPGSTPGQPAPAQGSFGRPQGGYGQPGGGARPGSDSNRGSQPAPQAQQRPAPQAQPRAQQPAPHENGGGGHENRGDGGGHDGRHH